METAVNDLPIVYELVAGYVADDPGSVAEVVDAVQRSGRIDAVLREVTGFGVCLITRARQQELYVEFEQLRSAVLSLLSRTLPAREEWAVSAALDYSLQGRVKSADAELGEGDAGDLLMVHGASALIAVLGTSVFGPGEFTAANLRALAEVARAQHIGDR